MWGSCPPSSYGSAANGEVLGYVEVGFNWEGVGKAQRAVALGPNGRRNGGVLVDGTFTPRHQLG